MAILGTPIGLLAAYAKQPRIFSLKGAKMLDTENNFILELGINDNCYIRIDSIPQQPAR